MPVAVRFTSHLFEDERSVRRRIRIMRMAGCRLGERGSICLSAVTEATVPSSSSLKNGESELARGTRENGRKGGKIGAVAGRGEWEERRGKRHPRRGS